MSSTWKVVASLALAILLATAGAWIVIGTKRPNSRTDLEQRQLSHEVEHWLELKNASLAAVENGQYAQADALLRELATAGLGEPVASRNWAIGRILAVAAIDEQTAPVAYRDALEKAEASSRLESRLEPSGPASHILAAKIAQLSHDYNRQVVELHAATGKSPSDPIIRHELYLAERAATDMAVRQDGENALRELGDLVPNNLYVLLESLSVLSRRHDAAVVPAFGRTRRLLLPFFPDDASTALARAIDAGEAAAKTGDWTIVTGAVEIIVKTGSSLVSVQNDRRRVDRGIDWYLASDFSERFYEKFECDRALTRRPVTVRFREEALDGLPVALNDVRDAKLVDADSDGRLEVAVLRRASFEIYRRSERGPNWNVFASASFSPDGFEHFLAADLHGDAAAKASTVDPDFVLFGPAGVGILENRVASDGRSRSIRIALPGELGKKTRGARSVALMDFDGDAALDLLVAVQESSAGSISVWRNLRNLQFEDVTSRSAIADAPISTRSLIALDWDYDRDADLMITVGSPKQALGFLKGEGEGRFHYQPIRTTEPIFQGASALAVLDADANGSWDLLASGPTGIALWLTSCLQPAQGRSLRTEVVSDFPAIGLFAFDYDNDGYQDVLAWSQDAVRLLQGNPRGHFEAADQDVLPMKLSPIITVDDGDIDGDGDIDLLAVTSDGAANTGFGSLRLLKNEGGNVNNWIDARLSNKGGFVSAGFGSVLQIKTGAVCQSQIVNKSITHFGIGQLERADVLRIVWPSGIASNVKPQSKNGTITEVPPARVLPALTQRH